MNQIQQIFGKSNPAGDPNGYKKEFAGLASAIDGLDNQAPGEIASAIHTLRVAFDQMSDRAQKGATSAQVSSEFDKANVKSANEQVSQYVSAKCGIGSDSSPTPKDRSTPDTSQPTPTDVPSESPTP